MFTKEMIEQDLKRLIDRYNETTNFLHKKYIKIGIRHNRNLLKYFEKRGITEIPMIELVYLMNTKYRYVQCELYRIERKIKGYDWSKE